MNWVTTSIRLYSALIGLYPKRFREAYGEELLLVFRDCAQDGHQRSGGWGVMQVWLGVLPDLMTSAAEQHAEEDMSMMINVLIGMLSGAGFIGGALWILASILILQRPMGIASGSYRDVADLLPLFFIGVKMVSMGLIGVFLLPSRPWKLLSRVLVLVAAGGGLVTGLLWQSYAASADWRMLVAGVLVQSACLALAGFSLMRQSRSRLWGLVLLSLAAAQLLFNFEDWRALFLAVEGLLVMGIMVMMFRPYWGTTPGTPAVS